MVTAINVNYKFQQEVAFHSTARPPPLLSPANINVSCIYWRGLLYKRVQKARSHLPAFTVEDAIAIALPLAHLPSSRFNRPGLHRWGNMKYV